MGRKRTKDQEEEREGFVFSLHAWGNNRMSITQKRKKEEKEG